MQFYLLPDAVQTLTADEQPKTPQEIYYIVAARSRIPVLIGMAEFLASSPWIDVQHMYCSLVAPYILTDRQQCIKRHDNNIREMP